MAADLVRNLSFATGVNNLENYSFDVDNFHFIFITLFH